VGPTYHREGERRGEGVTGWAGKRRERRFSFFLL